MGTTEREVRRRITNIKVGDILTHTPRRRGEIGGTEIMAIQQVPDTSQYVMALRSRGSDDIRLHFVVPGVQFLSLIVETITCQECGVAATHVVTPDGINACAAHAAAAVGHGSSATTIIEKE